MTENFLFHATEDNLQESLEFIKKMGVKTHLSHKVLFKLTLISEEIIVNIIKYAYPDTRGSVLIECETFYDEKLVVTIKNSGIPFNPLEKESPNTTLPLEARIVGGLGIFLAIKMSDMIEYQYKNGENILSFTLMSAT